MYGLINNWCACGREIMLQHRQMCRIDRLLNVIYLLFSFCSWKIICAFYPDGMIRWRIQWAIRLSTSTVLYISLFCFILFDVLCNFTSVVDEWPLPLPLPPQATRLACIFHSNVLRPVRLLMHDYKLMRRVLQTKWHQIMCGPFIAPNKT